MEYILSCPFNLSENTNRVLFEVTSKCNMGCKHCLYYNSEYSYLNNDMNTEEIENIIYQLSENSVKEIWLSGGEPLLRNDIYVLIHKISELGMVPSVSTNGYLVDEECAKKLKKNGVNYVHLSIDGINANIHDAFRGKKGAFEHVMNAIKFLRDEDIMVGATYVVTKQSINDIEKMVQLAINKGLKVISFYPIAPLGRGKKLSDFREDYKLITLLNQRAQILSEKYKENIRIEYFRTLNKNNTSTFLKECKGKYFFTITSDGELGTCPWLMKSQYNDLIVSLKEYSFQDAKIMVQKNMEDLLEKRNEKLSKYCEKCIGNKICKQGCPAVSDENGRDPLCYNIRKE